MKKYIKPEVACYDFELGHIIASSSDSYDVSKDFSSENTGGTEWDSRENSNNNGGGSDMWNSAW